MSATIRERKTPRIIRERFYSYEFVRANGSNLNYQKYIRKKHFTPKEKEESKENVTKIAETAARSRSPPTSIKNGVKSEASDDKKLENEAINTTEHQETIRNEAVTEREVKHESEQK